MLVNIGFSCKCNDVKPEVKITCNGIVLTESEVLIDADDMDLKSPTLHYIKTDIPSNALAKHNILQIHAMNISNKNKANGEIGFRVDHVVIDDIDLSYFYQGSTVYAPIPNNNLYDGFAQYLIQEGKADKITINNGVLTYIEKGEYVNYVNMPNGYLEFTFDNPVYDWVFKNNFGYSFLILRQEKD
jgi:hypothetical protein